MCFVVCSDHLILLLYLKFFKMIQYSLAFALLSSSAGGLYSGGSAQMVENSLDIHGDEILYVGDHIYTDVSQSKVHLRWRTALICRELEEEVSVSDISWSFFSWLFVFNISNVSIVESLTMMGIVY